MKAIYILSFLMILSTLLPAQSIDDWTWFGLPVLENPVGAIDKDADGNIWMTSSKKLVKYDGANWVVFDALESGIPSTSFGLRGVDASLSNTIWISTFDGVLEYEQAQNKWTVHDPTNGQVNVNGGEIKVESPNRIWWAKSSSLYEYNGISWKRQIFDAPDSLDINANSIREIEIDSAHQKWMTTSSSICIDGPGCFTPAGVMKLTDSDTTFFDAQSFGIPDADHATLELDRDNNPWVVFSSFGTQENFYSTYKNGQWSELIHIPLEGNIYDMKLSADYEMYLAFKKFIAIGKNDTWDVVPLDTTQIDAVSEILLTPEKDLYVTGRSPNLGDGRKGVLGILPALNYRARGKLYSDRNLNGTFDPADQEISYHFVKTVDKDRISFSDAGGNYSMLFPDTGTYEIEGVLPAYHFYNIPADGRHTVSMSTIAPTDNGNDIGFRPDTTVMDLSVTITSLDGATPGRESCYTVSVKSYAPKITDAEVIITIDDKLTFISSDPSPVSVNGNIYTFLLQGIQWLETRNIILCFSVPPDFELIGDTLKLMGLVNTMHGPDRHMPNNADTLCVPITGAFDPNYIAVDPPGKEATGNIPVTTPTLEYTIHFQNVGNDTAFNIVISNPIDPLLDIFSLQVIGSSHDYALDYIEDGEILKWTFNNILLPDSIASEKESHGFIKYIMNLSNHEVGTVYKNVADIYFDYNPPITTNTALNTLTDDTTSIPGIQADEVCGYVTHVIENTLQILFPSINLYKVEIYDLNGRLHRSMLVNHNEASMSLKELPVGIYFASVASDVCRETRKIVVKD